MNRKHTASKIGVAVLLLLSQLVHAQTGYELKGRFQGGKDGMIHARYNVGTKSVRDSVRLENGSFMLKGMLEYPTQITLTYSPGNDTARVTYELQQTRTYRLFLEAGARVSLYAKDSLSSALVKGSSLHDEYIAYRKELNKLYDRLRPVNMGIYRLEREGKSDSVAIYREQLRLLSIEEKKFLDGILKARPNSPVSLLAVYDFESPGAMTNKPTRPFFERLSPEMRQLPMGVTLKELLDKKDVFSVGKKALDFKLPDTAGRMVEFASLKDKYVLLDFWASWCGPCRIQHPFLREAYHQFKDAGFNIVSVSIDNSYDKWMAAIREDNVGEWIHLSELKGAKGDLAVRYLITSVPHNFLIDMSTKTIVGTDLFYSELDAKLKALLLTPKP
ncbi:MAG: thioredoxin-like domain-containing protein [Pseudobacter sp.]|uniref:thioredoxin-like domain-containing protein n=1 Tax=Pseudobacter sp. TaxID=2045420 RepID=UPI003F7D3006